MATMPEHSAADTYDLMAADYAAKNETGPFNALYERPATLSLLGDVAGKRVLDAGCGSGVLAAELVARGARVTGIEVSAGMADLARERLDRDVPIQVADLAQPLDFLSDASFDTVVSSLVLHYIEDWTTPLGTFARVLVPGGVAVISTHHPTMDWQLAGGSYLETRRYTDTWNVGGKPVDVTCWRRPLAAMFGALRSAGFEVEDIAEPLPLPECEARFPDAYQKLVSAPRFIFFRLRKRT